MLWLILPVYAVGVILLFGFALLAQIDFPPGSRRSSSASKLLAAQIAFGLFILWTWGAVELAT